MKVLIEKFEMVEVPELGIEITKNQHFNGKTYAQILEKVDESKIASYEILQKLRNIAFESNWEKYPFMKSFWVFVPNPDDLSKSKGYVSRLCADSGGAVLDSGGGPSFRSSGIGVFLYCPITGKAQE